MLRHRKHRVQAGGHLPGSHESPRRARRGGAIHWRRRPHACPRRYRGPRRRSETPPASCRRETGSRTHRRQAPTTARTTTRQSPGPAIIGSGRMARTYSTAWRSSSSEPCILPTFRSSRCSYRQVNATDGDVAAVAQGKPAARCADRQRTCRWSSRGLRRQPLPSASWKRQCWRDTSAPERTISQPALRPTVTPARPIWTRCSLPSRE